VHQRGHQFGHVNRATAADAQHAVNFSARANFKTVSNNTRVGSASTGVARIISIPDFCSAEVSSPSVGKTGVLDTSNTRLTPRGARNSAHCGAQPFPKTIRGGWSNVTMFMDYRPPPFGSGNALANIPFVKLPACGGSPSSAHAKLGPLATSPKKLRFKSRAWGLVFQAD
jgi:hypothetical protein